MATKIVTKNSSTGGSAPSASDLVQGELAVNVTDKRLYTENASGAIVELGVNPLGAVTMASTLGVTGVATLASLVATTADINAGTVDATTIGATTASTGAFTTLAASGVLTANAGVVVDNFTLDGTTLALSSGDMTLDVAGDITFDAGGGDWAFNDDGTTIATFANVDTGSFRIRSTVLDKDIIFMGNDGGVATTALTLDMSAAGAATFNSTVSGTIATFTGDVNARNFTGVDDGDTYINFPGSNVIKLNTGGAERMQISSSTTQIQTSGGAGNVLIGGGSGLSLAHDNGGATVATIKQEYASTSASAQLKIIGGFTTFHTGTSNAEMLRITSTGRLTRNGSTAANAAATFIGEVGSSYHALDFEHTAGGGVVGSVVTTASSTAYNTSSDYRLKENVVPMSGSIDRLKALKPSRFNFIVEPDTIVDGFLAHEAKEVVAECVTGSKDAMQDEEYEVTPAVYEDVTTPAVDAVDAVLDEDGAIVTEAVEAVEATTESVLVSEAVTDTSSVPDYQGIDQSKLVPLLVSALQEAIARIEALEAV